MNMRMFGDYLINLDRITYVRRFQPQLGPPIPGTTGKGGVSIFFDSQELTVYEDEAGYDELLAWMDSYQSP
jgi:hypothetical protein